MILRTHYKYNLQIRSRDYREKFFATFWAKKCIFFTNLFATFFNAELLLGFCSSSGQECTEAADGGATVRGQANNCQGLPVIFTTFVLFWGGVVKLF